MKIIKNSNNRVYGENSILLKESGKTSWKY